MNLPFYGVLLILAHVFTALIQWKPAVIQAFLETPVGPPGVFSTGIACLGILGGLLLFLLGRQFRVEEASDLWNFRLWAGHLGREKALFLFFCLILPQRIMDTNSGYVLIPPGTLLTWVMLLLDILRGVCCFGIFQNLFPAGQAGKTLSEKPAGEKEKNILPFAVGAMIFALLVQHTIFDTIPHVQDEIVQEWQAKIWAAGKSHASPMPCRESFLTWGLAENGQWLFANFQPGFSLILSLFAPLGRLDLVNPLMALLTTVVFHELLLPIYGGGIAGVASVLFSLSPFFLMMSSGRMNHVFALLLFLSCGWGFLKLLDGKMVRAALLCGLSCGLLLMTRRVDGAILVLSLAITLVTLSGLGRSRLVFASLFLPLLFFSFSCQVTLNRLQSGDSLQMIRHAEVMAKTFGEVSFLSLIQNSIDNLLGFQIFAFGGILPGLIGFLFLQTREVERMGQFERFLVIHAGLTVLTYGTYDYQDFCYGPRYYFVLLPAAALGAGKFLAFLSRLFRQDRLSRWRLLTIGFGTFLLFNQLWANFGSRYWHIDGEFEKKLSEVVKLPALVFLRGSTRVRIPVAKHLSLIGFSLQEVQELVSMDSLDFLKLDQELSELGKKDKEPALNLVAQYKRKALSHLPIDYEINETEVIRLNSFDILRQDRVVAIDGGDQPNQELMQVLPTHTPYLAFRHEGVYHVVPYASSGIPRFR